MKTAKIVAFIVIAALVGLVALTNHPSKGPGVFDTGPPVGVPTVSDDAGSTPPPVQLGVGRITTPATAPTTPATQTNPTETTTNGSSAISRGRSSLAAAKYRAMPSPEGLSGLGTCWWKYYNGLRSKRC